jgi:hypothetical protein
MDLGLALYGTLAVITLGGALWMRWTKRGRRWVDEL